MQAKSHRLLGVEDFGGGKDVFRMRVDEDEPTVFVGRNSLDSAVWPTRFSLDQIVFDTLNIVLSADGGNERYRIRVFCICRSHEGQPACETQAQYSDLYSRTVAEFTGAGADQVNRLWLDAIIR